MKTAIVFGAGKIARGFLGQLLFRSKYTIVFVEHDPSLVHSLRENTQYYVNVMGNPAESEWIKNWKCISTEDTEKINNSFLAADIIFTAVGGKNLAPIAKLIADAYQASREQTAGKQLTIVTCENWKDPAKLLQAEVERCLPPPYIEPFRQQVGITEAVVMRSAVEATQDIQRIDTNAVSVHDFWELPVDVSRWKGERQAIVGLQYLDNFQGFLQRKLYTFNGTNATIAYLGNLKGYRYLSDAANDADIEKILHDVQQEINKAVVLGLHIPDDEQAAFANMAKRKYQNKDIIDFVERHARDPIRKLGPNDRIVGLIRFIQTQGIVPDAIVYTLVAALHYTSTNNQDPSAKELTAMRKQHGLSYVAKEICGISDREPLAAAIHAKTLELREKGWLPDGM